MRNLLLLPVFAVMCATPAADVSAQWARANGFENLRTDSYAFDGSFVYAGTNLGVLRSTDDGLSWQSVSTGLPATTAFVVASVGATIYAGASTTLDGLYRSTDQGLTWASVNSGLVDHILGHTLQIISLYPGKSGLFAGTSDGLFRSTNGGDSWQRTELPSPLVNEIAENNTYLFVRDYLNRLVRSADQGAHWQEIDTGIAQPPNVQCFAVYNDTLLAIASLNSASNHLYLSGDNGSHWRAATGDLGGNSANQLALKDGSIFAATQGGVYLSTDLGSTWSKSIDLLNEPWSQALGINGNRLFASVGTNICVSSDNGMTWMRACTSVRSSPALGFLPTAGALLAGTDGKGVIISVNEGTSWIASNIGMGDLTIRALATMNGIVFAGADGGQFGGHAFRSTDGGFHWTRIDSGLSSPGTKLPNIRALVVKDSILFAGTEVNGIFRSKDLGESWVQINKGVSPGVVTSLAVLGGRLFAAAGDLLVSSNDGDSWLTLMPSSQQPGSCLAVRGDRLIMAGRRVTTTTDLGATWSVSDSGIGQSFVQALTVRGDMILAGTNGNGVFVSTNSGTSWEAVNDSLGTSNGGRLEILALDVVGSSIIVSTQEPSLFRRSLSQIVSVAERPLTSVPRLFSIEQNYPNPFNPSTRITYHIASFAKVELTVFDLLGRKVATLVDEMRQPGNYVVTWNAAGQASGVYYLRLRAGSANQTRSMILVR